MEADTCQMTMHGITVTITRSDGLDGAPVVFVDTDGVPEGALGPLMRVHVNDERVFVWAPAGRGRFGYRLVGKPFIPPRD